MVSIPLGGLDEDQLHQRKFLLGNERLKRKLRDLNLPGALTRITSSTREALGRTSAALSPYAGMCPSPGKRAATPEERRKEVTRQASETTSDRGVIVDIDWLRENRDLRTCLAHRVDLSPTI